MIGCHIPTNQSPPCRTSRPSLSRRRNRLKSRRKEWAWWEIQRKQTTSPALCAFQRVPSLCPTVSICRPHTEPGTRQKVRSHSTGTCTYLSVLLMAFKLFYQQWSNGLRKRIILEDIHVPIVTKNPETMHGKKIILILVLNISRGFVCTLSRTGS